MMIGGGRLESAMVERFRLDADLLRQLKEIELEQGER